MNKVVSAIAGSACLAFVLPVCAQELLATTNQGELAEIDLVAGTVTLIGDAGTFDGKDVGWTGLSFDSAGNLYAVSRAWDEPETGCPVSPDNYDICSHLYQLDAATGAVLAEIGNTQAPYISDIDLAPDGTLYGNQWDFEGALVTVSTTTAMADIVGHFGSPLENGGLSVNRATGESWAIESNFALDNGNRVSIFRVDATTGAAIPPVIDVGVDGSPVNFGFDSLEILPDGRFIATRARGSSQVYEIDPVPDAGSGLAEAVLIPLAMDPSITGNLNGLESLATPIVIDVISGRDRHHRNRINPYSRGDLYVAILGTLDFDALQVDKDTIRFGPDGAPARRCRVTRANRDRLPDLVCKFRIPETGLACESTEATLVAWTFGGQSVIGTDTIETKCRGRRHDDDEDDHEH